MVFVTTTRRLGSALAAGLGFVPIFSYAQRASAHSNCSAMRLISPAVHACLIWKSDVFVAARLCHALATSLANKRLCQHEAAHVARVPDRSLQRCAQASTLLCTFKVKSRADSDHCVSVVQADFKTWLRSALCLRADHVCWFDVLADGVAIPCIAFATISKDLALSARSTVFPSPGNRFRALSHTQFVTIQVKI